MTLKDESRRVWPTPENVAVFEQALSYFKAKAKGGNPVEQLWCEFYWHGAEWALRQMALGELYEPSEAIP